jgi:hypothetical protein
MRAVIPYKACKADGRKKILAAPVGMHTLQQQQKKEKEPAKLTCRPQTLAQTDHHTIKRQKLSQTPILRLPMVSLTLNQYK